MGIFQALGLGLLILILKSLVPEILSHLESTAIAFLNGAEVSANVASQLASTLPALKHLSP